MRNSLFLFFVLLFSFSVEAKEPQVVYLKGACCSGKTSLNKQIAKEWRDWTIVDDDALVIDIWSEALAQRYQEVFEAASDKIGKVNLYHAIRFGDLVFNQEVTDIEQETLVQQIAHMQKELNHPESLAWRQLVHEKVRKRVLEETTAALTEGHNVLIDSWYYTAEKIEELFPQAHMTRVMLYSSLPKAYERLQKRNRDSVTMKDMDQARNIAQLMITFTWLYKVSDASSQSIQPTEKSTFEEIFSLMAQRLEEKEAEDRSKLFTFSEFSFAEFMEMKNDFMRPFEEQQGPLFLSPYSRQDLIIDTSDLATEEILQLLQTHLVAHAP